MTLKTTLIAFFLIYSWLPANGAEKKQSLVQDVQETIKKKLNLDHLKGLSGKNIPCFFIESRVDREGKLDETHKIIVEELIKTVAPNSVTHFLEKDAIEEQPGIFQGYLAQELETKGIKPEQPIIVNFSGDFVQALHYIGSGSVPYEKERGEIYRNFMRNDVDFWEGIEGKDQQYLEKNSKKIADISIRTYNYDVKEAQQDKQERRLIVDSALHQMKALQTQEEDHEKFAKSLVLAEYEANREFSSNIQKHIYQPMLKGGFKDLILVAAMGNDREQNPIVEIFGPQRALFADQVCLSHMINVINLNKSNGVSPTSDRPDNHGRGDEVTHTFFGDPIQNPLQMLAQDQLTALQNSTIAIQGEWSDEVCGTSAAAPLITGALLLLQEGFPALSWEQLREAVLYSADRTFTMIQEDDSGDQDATAVEYVDGEQQGLREKMKATQKTTGVPIKDFPSEVYGQGIFNIERALIYAKLLHDAYCANKEIAIKWPKAYNSEEAVLRRQLFNTFKHK